MKKLMTIFIVIAAILAVVVIAKDAIAKAAIEKGVEGVTGLQLTMDKFKLGLTDSTVGIKGLKLYNPDEFEEEIMVDLPEIFLSVDIPAFFKNKAHIKELRINLSEFSVIKNKDGKLNLDSLTALSEGKEKPAAPKKEKKDGEAMDLQIDVLDLKIGTVRYLDHTLLGKATSQTFDAKIDERFENITDPNVLVKTIIAKALKNTTIGRLANFDMGSLQGAASGVADAGKKMATDAMGQATKQFDALQGEAADKLDSSKEAAEKTLASATDSAKDLAGSLKDSAGGLLGSIKSKAQNATS